MGAELFDVIGLQHTVDYVYLTKGKEKLARVTQKKKKNIKMGLKSTFSIRVCGTARKRQDMAGSSKGLLRNNLGF